MCGRDTPPSVGGMPIHLHRRTRATALAAALAGTATLVFASTALATFPGRNGAIAFSAQTDQGVQLFTVGKDGGGGLLHRSATSPATPSTPIGRRTAGASSSSSMARRPSASRS